MNDGNLQPVALGVVVKTLFKGLAAFIAVGAWVLAALWMLLPVSSDVASDSSRFAELVACPPPAWVVVGDETAPGCLERRALAPSRALTAVVIALPATWVWIGLRVPPLDPEEP